MIEDHFVIKGNKSVLKMELELCEEANVIFVKFTDVGNAVPPHTEAFDS